MSVSFVASLREALQCAMLVALLIVYLKAAREAYALLAGFLLALLSGFVLNYTPLASAIPLDNEKWSLIRNISELSVLYLGLLLSLLNLPPDYRLGRKALFGLGFVLFVFESRDLWFVVHDVGLIKENASGSAALALLGTVAGFSPLVFFFGGFIKIPSGKVFTVASLLVTLGALKLATGGVGEIGPESIMTVLHTGAQGFLENAVGSLRETLLLSGHPFMDVPFTWFSGFLSGDRMAMAFVVLFVTAPPVRLLMVLFSRPDPELEGMDVPAQRRLRLAFFRRELILLSSPLLVSFFVILLSLHAASVAANPLSEPVPVPLMESEEQPGVLVIPLADKLGDFSDQRLRKYLYYYGDKQVTFIAIMKPDGTVGVALDECEICKPAEWNKSALGYAQRGDHLVCKYCMTPIPTESVNKPGGCNPIPIPFSVRERTVVINLEDLIRVYKEAKSLEKKGTHL